MIVLQPHAGRRPPTWFATAGAELLDTFCGPISQVDLMRQSIGRVVNAFLEPAGYHVSRLPKPASAAAGPVAARGRDITALESALTRIVGRGLAVNTIIDVGASNGLWTRKVHPYFPKAQRVMVEANPVHEASLQQFTQKFDYADCVLAAAGDTVGAIYFDAADAFSGLASHTPLAVPTITVPATTIDTLVAERHLVPPFLIKLDTHGFEEPILQGARAALRQTNLLIIEAHNFQLTATSLKVYDLCRLVGAAGFAPVDFCEPLWRARDNAFWQFDLFFVRDDRPEFGSNDYR